MTIYYSLYNYLQVYKIGFQICNLNVNKIKILRILNCPTRMGSTFPYQMLFMIWTPGIYNIVKNQTFLLIQTSIIKTFVSPSIGNNNKYKHTPLQIPCYSKNNKRMLHQFVHNYNNYKLLQSVKNICEVMLLLPHYQFLLFFETKSK